MNTTKRTITADVIPAEARRYANDDDALYIEIGTEGRTTHLNLTLAEARDLVRQLLKAETAIQTVD